MLVKDLVGLLAKYNKPEDEVFALWWSLDNLLDIEAPTDNQVEAWQKSVRGLEFCEWADIDREILTVFQDNLNELEGK